MDKNNGRSNKTDGGGQANLKVYKKKTSQNSSLSFQFFPETGPNEALDSFDCESNQPIFGIKKALLKTPQTKLDVNRNSSTTLSQHKNQLLFNTDQNMKTEESANFSEAKLEKEIFTEDSNNSIKINKFEEIEKNQRDTPQIQIEGEMTLGSRQDLKDQGEPLIFNLQDLNSALPKVYNNIENDLSKKRCENMESFGVIRSLSQNSQDLQNSAVRKQELALHNKMESSNDTLSRDQFEKFQEFQQDDPSQGSIFASKNKYVSMINVSVDQPLKIKPESPQILADISRGKKSYQPPESKVMETPGFPKHRIQFKTIKVEKVDQKRSRNTEIKGRKFYNSMDKIDRIMIQEIQEERKKEQRETLGLNKSQNLQSKDRAQSFTQITINNIDTNNRQILKNEDKINEQVAPKSHLSDLVSDEIDKLGSYFRETRCEFSNPNYSKKVSLEHNNQSFEKLEETPKYGNQANVFSDALDQVKLVMKTTPSIFIHEEESKGTHEVVESNNQTTIYDNQNHTRNSDSQSYTFSGEDTEQPRMLITNKPSHPEIGDRGSSISNKNSLSQSVINNVNPSVTERLRTRTPQMPQKQQDDEVCSEKIYKAKRTSLLKDKKRRQEHSDSNLSKNSPQTAYQSYRQHEGIQYAENYDSLSQFTRQKGCKIKRGKTRINIIRGNEDDDKQSIKRLPKRMTERQLTEKQENQSSIENENPGILNLIPMMTEQPRNKDSKLNIQLQNCSQDLLSNDESLVINSSPTHQNLSTGKKEQAQVQKKILLIADKSPEFLRAPSFGSELEIRIEDNSIKKEFQVQTALNENMIGQSYENTPQSQDVTNTRYLLNSRNNQSQKLLDVKKFKRDRESPPGTHISSNSLSKTMKRKATRIDIIDGTDTHQTVDNIGSPVQLRSRFCPRKKDSLKKIDKPDRPSLTKKKSMRKQKKASLSNIGSNNNIVELMSQLEEHLIKRDSGILETSVIDKSSSTISKPGSGVTLDFSKNVSSSYLKDKQELIDSPLKVSQYRQMTQDMFLQINKIKEMMTTEYQELPPDKIIDFKFKKKGFKKLLLFDLDETLIHIWRDQSELEEGFVPEIDIPIIDPITNEQELYGLSVRPFVKECLQFANKYFEVGVFTASFEWFASQILDYLDPDGTLIQHRYYRQHTSQLEDLLVKDLNIFQGEVTLDDILIVDNNIYCFAFQLENGIPILDFMGDSHDSELLKVMKYLQQLGNSTNLRLENEKTYKLKEIFKYNMEDYIQYYESDEWSDEEDKDFDDDGVTEHMTAQKLDQISGNEYGLNDGLSSEERRMKENQLSMSECSSSLKYDAPNIRLISSPKSVSPPQIPQQISPQAYLQTSNGLNSSIKQDLMSRNHFEFQKNTSNETNIIKLNPMTGNDEQNVSVEELSQSEVDLGGLESMNRYLGRIHMNFNQYNGESPKSSKVLEQVQDLSFNRNDSPTSPSNRYQTQNFDLNVGAGLLEVNENKELFTNGSSGGTKDDKKLQTVIQRIPEVEEEEKVPAEFQFEHIGDDQIPSELQDEIKGESESEQINIDVDVDSILQNSERAKHKKKARLLKTAQTNEFLQIKTEQFTSNLNQNLMTEEDQKATNEKDIISPKIPQSSAHPPLRQSLIESDLETKQQQTSVFKSHQSQKQQKLKIIGHKKSSKSHIQFLTSGKKKSSAMSTIVPPCWDVRKQVVNQRLRTKSELPEKVIKAQSVLSAKYIDVKLDKLNAEMDKYWESGAMRNGLLKNNPSINEKYIIQPQCSVEKKNTHPLILIQEEFKQNTAIKPPRPLLNLTGVPKFVKKLTTPKHERNFSFQMYDLKKKSLRIDNQSLSDIKRYYEHFSYESESIAPSGTGTAQSYAFRGPEQFLTPNKQDGKSRAFDNYRKWSQNKRK